MILFSSQKVTPVTMPKVDTPVTTKVSARTFAVFASPVIVTFSVELYQLIFFGQFMSFVVMYHNLFFLNFQTEYYCFGYFL